MVKVAKTYRIHQQRLAELKKIQGHLNERYKTAADMTGTTPKAPTDIEALEFAIQYAFRTLQEEGYIK
jgi:hypothetical protein